MMAVLMGVRDKAAIARACDLGVAMQLTNIARDVGEDARAGRIYLPLDWLAEARIDIDDFVARAAFSPAMADVVRRVLDQANVYYQRGLAGVDHLPMQCRAAIVAAADIYADIGRVIAANGYDSVTKRAVVPTRRKLMLVANAVAGLNFSSDRVTAGPSRATAFLVNAVDPSVALVRGAPAGPAEQVLDLIMKLERRDRAMVDAAT
jgi:phytoene synthase